MAEGSERKTAAKGSTSDPAPNERRHKRVGTSVRGKYKVDAFIATGTMANVYAATHRNGSRVALKILHKQLAEDASLCERFKREGYFANSIGHPGIVRAIDDDVTEDGCPFLVMELLEGETMEERRRRKGGRLPASWVLPVADSLLEILAAAHAREVVHRDLKPDNVFVTKTGEVKLLDLGVARWNDGQDSSDMTAVGMVLGTPAYMPPEQALGRREDVDAQSDIWAVGATLFVVLSGESVHVGGDAKAKLIATARTPARPLNEAAPDVPRSIAAVIDRALMFHKNERWPDADAMREALRWARMSLDDRPSQQDAITSTSVPAPSLPPETRRNTDDEPTLARAFSREELGQSPSRDFMTSAPPITMRDARKAAAAATTDPLSSSAELPSTSDPIFSLRREREKEGGIESSSPSTERFPKPEGTARGSSSYPPSPGGPSASGTSSSNKTAPGIGELPVTPAFGVETPAASEERALSSMDVKLTFTKPMVAMVMPADWPAPRPAAGAPPENSSEPAAFAPTFAEPFYPTNPLPPNAPSGSVPPPGDYPSAPPQQALTGPPARAAVAAVDTAPSLHGRASLPPGPVLSQIVKPNGSRFYRVVVPVMLGFLALIAGFIALRTRAANARARANAGAVVAPAGTAATPAVASAAGAGASTSTTAPSTSTSTSTTTTTTAPGETAVVAAAAATEPTVKKKKKPKPRPKPAAPVVTASEPAAEPATTATTPTEAPPPVDTTPKDSLPNKDPEPRGDTGGN